MLDYHMHLENYPYEVESIQKFLRHGISRGIQTFGFSEHSHHFKEFWPIYQRQVILDESPEGQYQKNWLTKEPKSFCYELREYVQLVETAKKEGLPVLLGLEVCYFPGEEKSIEAILRDIPFDYIIGSVHWLNGWGFDTKKEFWQGKDVNKVFNDYAKVICSAIESHLFDVIAHPYSCKAFGAWPSDSLQEDYRRIARLAVQNKVDLELNAGLAYRYPVGSVCPPTGFIQIASEEGCTFSLGSDSHRAEDCGRGIAYLQQLAKEFRIEYQSGWEKRARTNVPMSRVPTVFF